METWKTIPFTSDYEISDLGRVRRATKKQRTHIGKILAPHVMKHGYLRANLAIDGKMKGFLIHRLVMLAFVGPSELHVNHKNGKKEDNSLANLEYVTQQENTAHAKNELGAYLKGSDNPNSKLDAERVREIRRLDNETDLTQRQIASLFGICQATVKEIIHRRTWTHV